MHGEGAPARRGPRGGLRILPTAIVTVSLILAAAVASTAADVAVVQIEYKVNGGQGESVATQSDRVDVVAFVKNLGTEPVRGVSVSYIYVNEVTGFKWEVSGTYSVAEIEPGGIEQSTVYSWRPVGVDAGRYYFEATASVSGTTDEVPCNNVFPRRPGTCAAVEGTQDPASIAILTSSASTRLVQALYNDPVPAKGIRVPTGCVVSFTTANRTALSSIYAVPVVNVGSEAFPSSVIEHEDRGYMGYARTSTSGSYVLQKDLLDGRISLTVTNDDIGFASGLGARYTFSFQLNFEFLADEVPEDANLAEPAEVGIQVKLFAEDAPTEDYNQFTIPENSNSMLGVYAPVIKWLYPGCETSGSDRPLGVAPGLRTGLPDPRLYVPVIGADGEYYVRVARVTDQGLEIQWLVDDIPLPGRVEGLYVDGSAGIIYVSCADGSLLAIEDNASVFGEDFDVQPRELWRKTGIGEGLSRPEIIQVGSTKTVVLAADDGLHLVSTSGTHTSRSVAIAAPTGETIAVAGDPLAVGRYAYFSCGDWIGRVDVGATDVGASLELLPVETVTTDLVRSDDDGHVFFGTDTGRLYALAVSEPLVSLGRSGKSILLQAAGVTRVTGLDAVTDDGSAWLYASTLDGGLYRAEFDLGDGKFAADVPISLFSKFAKAEDVTDLPVGGLAGVSVSRNGDLKLDDRPAVSIGLGGELLAYRGDLEQRLDCRLWGNSRDADLRRTFRFDIDAPLSSWTAWEASNTSYLVLTSEETGQLYGLDLDYIVEP